MEHTPPVASHHAYDGPAAPWSLHGSMCASLWRLPVGDLPWQPPGRARVLSLAGHALVVTAWANYEPGGTLSYREFLFAVAVRGAGVLGPACTVGPIWVDDHVAAAGGQHLWGIPKRLGVFDAAPPEGFSAAGVASRRASLTEQDLQLVTMDFEPGRRMPLPARLSLWTVQDGRSGPLRTRCTVHGRLRLGNARWHFAETGPLAFLRGRAPLASACLEHMSARFGV